MKILRLLFAPISLLCAFMVGLSCPALHVYGYAVPYLVMGMLFMVFLQLDWTRLRIRISNFSILLANLTIPLTFYFVLYTTGHPILAIGAFLAGIAPTGSAAPSVISFLRQDIEYGVTSFVMTTFGITIAVPLILPYLLPSATEIGFWGLFLPTAQRICFLVFTPVIASLIIRVIMPSAQHKFPKGYRMFSFILWVCCITIMLSGASYTIWEKLDPTQRWFVPQCFGIALSVCIVNFGLGYFLSSKYPHEASQTLGQKNIAVPVALAYMTQCNPLMTIVPLMYILCHNSWNSYQMIALAIKDGQKN